jgi:hypothetical protein
MRMDLTALANKSRADKGAVTGLGHRYSLVYERISAGWRLEPEVTTCSIDWTADDLPSIDGADRRRV